MLFPILIVSSFGLNRIFSFGFKKLISHINEYLLTVWFDWTGKYGALDHDARALLRLIRRS